MYTTYVVHSASESRPDQGEKIDEGAGVEGIRLNCNGADEVLIDILESRISSKAGRHDPTLEGVKSDLHSREGLPLKFNVNVVPCNYQYSVATWLLFELCT